jgi:hypothetical protein
MRRSVNKGVKTRMAVAKQEKAAPALENVVKRKPGRPRKAVAAIISDATARAATAVGSHATYRANGAPLALRVTIGTSTFEISGVDQVDVL